MLRVAALLTVTRRYAKPFAAGIAAASPSRLVSGVAAICSAGAAANCADKQPSIPLVPDGTVRLLNATDGASVAKSIVASFGPGGADVAVKQLDSTVHAAFSPRCGGGKPSKKDAADAKPAGLDDKVVAPAPAPAPAPATAPATTPAAAPATAPATASAPAPGVLKIEPAAKGVKQEPAAPEAPKKEPSAAKDEKKSSWSGPSTCPGIRPAFAELAGPVGFIAAALESTCAALQTSGEMNEKQAVEFCVKNAPSACERSEWAAELARLLHFASPERREARKANEQAARDAAKTDEAAFRAALVSVATECCGLEAGAVTAAASTSGSDATRPGLVRLATKVLRARLAGGPLNGVFTPAARTKWRSRTHLDDAKARPHASRADYRKGLGEAYDDLAAALASFFPADVLPKPSKKAEGFTELTGPKLFAPATRVLDEIVAAATAAAGPTPAPAPDATHPMDVDNAGADAASPEALRTESGDAPAPTPAPSQGERPIASRDDAAQLKARRRMIASAGAHGDGAVASLVELFGPLGLGAELAEELVRGLDRDDAKAHEKSKPKEAVAAPRTARRAPVAPYVARRASVARRLTRDHARLDAVFATAEPTRRSIRAPQPRQNVADVGGRPHKRSKVPKRVAVGARVVWKGYKGVVEAEVTPGVFRVLFDKCGFRETVRAEELCLL